MSDAETFRLFSDYNRWMNGKLYDAAAALPRAELMTDRGAFFGSIFGTLGHLVVADTTWLKRFRRHASGSVLEPLDAIPAPAALNALPFAELPALRERRDWLDARIADWTATLDETALATPLEYANTRGERFRRPLAGLLLHFFNHQTHHRGQATTLFHQAGVDVGVTDLHTLVPHLGDD